MLILGKRFAISGGEDMEQPKYCKCVGWLVWLNTREMGQTQGVVTMELCATNQRGVICPWTSGNPCWGIFIWQHIASCTVQISSEPNQFRRQFDIVLVLFTSSTRATHYISQHSYKYRLRNVVGLWPRTDT